LPTHYDGNNHLTCCYQLISEEQAQRREEGRVRRHRGCGVDPRANDDNGSLSNSALQRGKTYLMPQQGIYSLDNLSPSISEMEDEMVDSIMGGMTEAQAAESTQRSLKRKDNR